MFPVRPNYHPTALSDEQNTIVLHLPSLETELATSESNQPPMVLPSNQRRLRPIFIAVQLEPIIPSAPADGIPWADPRAPPFAPDSH